MDGKTQREKLNDVIYNIEPEPLTDVFDRWQAQVKERRMNEKLVTVYFDKKGNLHGVDIHGMLTKEKQVANLIDLLERLRASEIWPEPKDEG